MLIRREGSSRSLWLIVGAVVAVTLLLACLVVALALSLIAAPDVFDSDSATEPTVTAGVTGGVATIAVLDVDQGQAVAVISPGGQAALIDAGRSQARVEDELAPYLRSLGVNSLEYLILSHPDQDHVGGMPAVLELFDVATWVDPGIPTTNQTYGASVEMVLDQDIDAVRARQGEVLNLGDAVRIELLWPQDDFIRSDGEPDSNENSAVVRITFAGVSILVPGDLETRGEAALVEQLAEDLQSDVLIVGHHGSNSSSGAAFLDAVDPEVAIISAGENNPYGHPHDEVLQRLRFRGIEIYRTDLDGTINIVISNGDFAIETVETSAGT
jgi:competence protein ComEC